MRFSSTTVLLSFNILLVGVASYIGGALLSTWLKQQILSTQVSPSGTYKNGIEKLPADPGKSQKTFEVILERNIFDAQKTEIELPPPLPEPETVTSETVFEETVERTKLAIALAGTMIYGAKNSFAFISKKDSLHKYVIYGIGDCFNAETVRRDKDCSTDSVKVLGIKDRWVLIQYQGKNQALWMVSADTVGEEIPEAVQSKKAQNKNVPPQKSTALVVTQKEKIVSKNSVSTAMRVEDENTFHFQRVWVDEQLTNFEQLLNDARVVPTKKDKKSYFMFQYIKDESIYEKLGLKQNDIIIDINGFLVDTIGKALKLLEILQSEREISLKIEREGKPVQFHYYID